MQYCVASHCKNTDQDYNLFQFPKDPVKLLQWKTAMNRPNWKISNRSRICEVHFDASCFTSSAALREDACPTNYFVTNYERLPNSKTTKKMENLQNDLEESHLEIALIRKQNEDLGEALNSCQTKLSNLEKYKIAMEKIFEDDQIQRICHNSTQNWSSKTLQNALQLKFSCGMSGYEKLLQLNYPIPSIRTLSRKLVQIPFEPGILREMFKYLAMKVENFDSTKRDCCLLLDEMAIIPGNDLETLENNSEIATHILVVMISGISTQWQQIVAYHFTNCDRNHGNSLAALVQEILIESYSIGLNVVNVTSDMSPSSQTMWRSLRIYSEEERTQNFIYNTVNSSYITKKIYFMADVRNLLKNLQACLLSNKTRVIISDYFVNEYNLPTNLVESGCYQKKSGIEKNLTETKLSENCFYNQPTKLESSNLTNAWFLEMVNKWFKLMTSQTDSLAINKLKITDYVTTFDFLKEFITLFKTLVISKSDKPKWEPIQAAIILSTQTMLDLQNELNHELVFTSRFTNNALQKVFCQLKHGQNAPNFKQARNLLKHLCVIQDFDFLKSNENMIKNEISLNCKDETVDDNISLMEVIRPPEDWTSIGLNKSQLHSLYGIAEIIVSKIIRSTSCEKCVKSLKGKKLIKSVSKLFFLRQRNNANFIFVSENVFKTFIIMEQLFQSFKIKYGPELCQFNAKDLLEMEIFAVRTTSIDKFIFPKCHYVDTTLIELFCIFRLRSYLDYRKRQKRGVTIRNNYL